MEETKANPDVGGRGPVDYNWDDGEDRKMFFTDLHGDGEKQEELIQKLKKDGPFKG